MYLLHVLYVAMLMALNEKTQSYPQKTAPGTVVAVPIRNKQTALKITVAYTKL